MEKYIMKKYLLILMALLFINMNAQANESYNTFVKNLATCSPCRHTSFLFTRTDQEILGWKNGGCVLRFVQYGYNVPEGVDPFALSQEQLNSYLVPSSVDIYSLTRSQLIDYQKNLINGMKNSQNKASITVSTKNMHNRVKAINHYEYKNGRWVNSNAESYLMF
jgi:hypothetical protein